MLVLSKDTTVSVNTEGFTIGLHVPETFQWLYSRIKEMYMESDLICYEFPLLALTPVTFKVMPPFVLTEETLENVRCAAWVVAEDNSGWKESPDTVGMSMLDRDIARTKWNKARGEQDGL